MITMTLTPFRWFPEVQYNPVTCVCISDQALGLCQLILKPTWLTFLFLNNCFPGLFTGFFHVGIGDALSTGLVDDSM